MVSRSAIDLGAIAIRAALERGGVRGDVVDYVIMGQVVQAGAGQNPARQAAARAGVPMTVPAITLNKVCPSSLYAIALADQLIRAGEIEAAVAGGMESMTDAPYLVRGARRGLRMGDGAVVDAMIHDGLWSTFTGQTMGSSSDEVNRELRITREDQDLWAARSHARACDAWVSGRFGEEVVPVEIAEARGGRVEVRRDEGMRSDTTVELLARLRPAFSEDGTITAGNASQMSDAAAAVVVMSGRRCHELGIQPLAEVLAHGMCATDYAYLHTAPALALQNALKKVGMEAGELGLLEINEAFASVAVHATRMVGVDESRVNVNGGAVALGHPLGATGARMMVTLLHEMRRRGLELGAATLCGGGGQGDALVLRAAPGTSDGSRSSVGEIS